MRLTKFTLLVLAMFTAVTSCSVNQKVDKLEELIKQNKQLVDSRERAEKAYTRLLKRGDVCL